MKTPRRFLKSYDGVDYTQADLSVKVDDGCDHTNRILWAMNSKRNMRNGKVVLKPAAPQVAPVTVTPKKKPRKRGHRVVQQAIGAV